MMRKRYMREKRNADLPNTLKSFYPGQDSRETVCSFECDKMNSLLHSKAVVLATLPLTKEGPPNYLGLYDFSASKPQIKFLLLRHESSCTHMFHS